jgi:hypothetical protein
VAEKLRRRDDLALERKARIAELSRRSPAMASSSAGQRLGWAGLESGAAAP